MRIVKLAASTIFELDCFTQLTPHYVEPANLSFAMALVRVGDL